ncbi:hypothetical protein SNE40_012836 [Patella caerulea]|uniref:ubiquitinyl hydrolase 1 n=1 Tax=Patella caerulea TaxID=87958 RepID=A0AAN8PFZ3_PATCE
MDPSNQEVCFVELNGLDQESYSEVFNILHGQKQSKKVEFPWETKSDKENDEVSKDDLASLPKNFDCPPAAETPQMMYAIVPTVVPLPMQTVVAPPYPIPTGGLVNGIPPPGPYPHGVIPQDVIIDMASPVKTDIQSPDIGEPNYVSLSHCNGPVPAQNFSSREGNKHNVHAEGQYMSNQSTQEQAAMYVTQNITQPKDNKPIHGETQTAVTQSNKNSLDEAIKSSKIFSQVLGGGKGEPSTGISFLADDNLEEDVIDELDANEVELSFLGEDQFSELENLDSFEADVLSKPQEVEEGLLDKSMLEDSFLEDPEKQDIEVTVSINNHEQGNENKDNVNTQKNSPFVNQHGIEKAKAVSSERDSIKTQSASKGSSPGPSPDVAPPKSKSWAGLFKSTASKSAVVYVNHVPDQPSPIVTLPHSDKKREEEILQPVAASEDSATSELGALLSRVKLNHASVALQPRGLINNNNWCYINSTLQALIACPPFYHLMKKLSDFPPMSRGSSSTPILDSMLEFVSEFNAMPKHYETTANGHKYDKNRKNFDLEPGLDFEPKYIHDMLHVIEVNPAFKLGKQEDAEEFLSILLDGLHEEMVAAININLPKDKDTRNAGQANGVSQDVDDDDDEDDSWEQVGPKNKSVVTRRATFSKTPISDIFAGQMRSVVSKTGSKESATLQPYFTLQLDIQGKVFSVRDALEGLVSKEIVEDFFDKKTNQKIEIMRRTTLEELPPVLILHLKCFVYNAEGSQKLLKNIDFDVDLKITKDLVSPTAKIPTSHKSYKLFAVVYHHGVKSTGGHYTNSVFHPGINGWIHIDDRRIETVSVQKVLKYTPPRMPYLLYYRRTDLTYS